MVRHMPFSSSQQSVANSLEVKVAGVTIDALGRKWDPSKHPRDSRGRFIETGGIVRVGLGELGKVIRSMAGGKVEVQMGDGSHRIVPHQQLTMIRRPDGSKPTMSVAKVAKEDTAREAHPQRGDGKREPDLNPDLPIPSVDPKDEHTGDGAHDDNDTAKHPVPEAYTPSRDDAREGDLLVVTARGKKSGRPQHIMARVETTKDGKPDKIRLAGSNRTVQRDSLPGDPSWDTVIPREDVKDPAALFSDTADGDKPLVMDAEEAADLVEGHAKDTHFNAPTEHKTDPEKVTADDVTMAGKNGEVAVAGRKVGTIHRNPDGTFTATTNDGKQQTRKSWDAAAKTVATHVNKHGFDGAQEQPKEKPAQKAPAAKKPSRGATSMVHTDEGSKGFLSKSGNLLAVKGTNGMQVYRRTNTPENQSAHSDHLHVNGQAFEHYADEPMSGFRAMLGDPQHDHAAEDKPNLPKTPQQQAHEDTLRQEARSGIDAMAEQAQAAKRERDAQQAAQAPEQPPRAPQVAPEPAPQVAPEAPAAPAAPKKDTPAMQKAKEWIAEHYGDDRASLKRIAAMTKAKPSIRKAARQRLAELDAQDHHNEHQAPAEHTPAAPEVPAAPEAPAAPEHPADHGSQEHHTPSPDHHDQFQESAAAHDPVAHALYNKTDTEENYKGRSTDRLSRAGMDHEALKPVYHDAEERVRTSEDRQDAAARLRALGDELNQDAKALDAIGDSAGMGPEYQRAAKALHREADRLHPDPARHTDEQKPAYPETHAPEGAKPDAHVAAGVRQDRPGPLEEVAPDGVRSNDSQGSDSVLPEARPTGEAAGGRELAGDRGRGQDGRDNGREAASDQNSADDRGAAGSQGDSAAGAGAGDTGPGGPSAAVADEGAHPDEGDALLAGVAPHRHPGAHRFQPKSQADLMPKGPRKKAQANIAALRMLAELEEEGRAATPEEQAVLARWSGWGALGQEIFSDSASHAQTYAKERAALKDLLTPQQYESARANTMNAHYTDASMVQAMWGAMQDLGFRDGAVLEPGSGAGTFMGFKPNEDTTMVGVEMDPITAAISQYLYPDEFIENAPLQKWNLPDGTFDAVIGNVPFAKHKPFDKDYNPTRKHSLHNFALLKSLGKTKPGGLVMLMTSNHTMDSRNDKARRAMYEQADLVGAIRLPSGSHKDSAGTDVVTDVLIFRKRLPDETPGDASWVDSVEIAKGEDGKPIRANRYFTQHKENVLGEMGVAKDLGLGGLRSANELAVKGDTENMGQQMRDALARVTADARRRGNVLDTTPDPDAAEHIADLIASRVDDQEGTITADPTDSGKFWIVQNGRRVPLHVAKVRHAKVRRLLELRDLTHQLLEADRVNPNEAESPEAKRLRKALNTKYDAFVKANKGKPINDSKWVQSSPKDTYFTSDEGDPRPRRGVDVGSLEPGDILRWHGTDSKGKPRRAVVATDDNEEPITNPDGALLVHVIGETTKAEREHWVKPGDAPYDVLGTREKRYRLARQTPKELNEDAYGIALLSSLESYDPETNTAEKGSIFSKRTLRARDTNGFVSDPEDAIRVVQDRGGAFNYEAVGKVMGTDAAAARRALGSRVLTDPETGELVTREKYLGGDVRKKLRAAEAAVAAGRTEFQPNVQALSEGLPEYVGSDRIKAKMGASWIDPDLVRAFLYHLTGDETVTVDRLYGSRWVVDTKRSGADIKGDEVASGEWGTKDRSVYDLVESLLNRRKIEIRRSEKQPDGSTKKWLDKEATEAAQNRAEKLNGTVDNPTGAFQSWIWNDPDRAQALLDQYNDDFNGLVKTEYSDAPMHPEGMSETFTMYGHQAAGVRRILNEETALLAHEVGAGKTLTISAAAMELRRLGLANKPAVVVPNHMKEQWQREFLTAFPQGKVLAIANDDLKNAADRERFLARAATGDWDAVIVTEDAFKRIRVSHDTEEEYIDYVVGELREAVSSARARALAAGEDVENDKTVKGLEDQLANLEESLRADLANERESGLSWEQLGIDYLFVDEAHRFKNLRRISSTSESLVGSKKAADLEMKLRHMRQNNTSGRVATFATATPIANSLGEMHTVIKYLRPDLLEERGITDFDTFLADFAQEVTEFEMTPDGGGFAPKTRLAKFYNMPGLVRMWQQFADVMTAEDLDLDTPDIDGGRPEVVLVPGSDWLKEEYVPHLVARAEAAKHARPEKGTDNILVINGDGTAAALHPAMVGGPEEAGNGKIGVVAQKAAAIYEDTKDNVYLDPQTDKPHERKGAFQIMFLDQGTPGADKRYADKIAKGDEPVGDTVGFDAYKALKQQMIAEGIPEDKIAFIHDAKNDAQKAELFQKCRDGRIAVLVGSTEKMGVGTNIQDRAVALHNIDCPYRPADIQQRVGRAERQKNQNGTIRVLNYATEGSLDTRLWDGQERKATLIAQIMRGDLNSDEAEDIAPTVLNASEMKAASSGNETLLHKVKTDKELNKLLARKRDHEQSQINARTSMKQAQANLTDNTRLVETLEAAQGKIQTTEDGPIGFTFTVGEKGKKFAKRVDANKAYMDEIRKVGDHRGMSDGPEERIGSIGGFDVFAQRVWNPLEQGGEVVVTIPDLPATRNKSGKVFSLPQTDLSKDLDVLTRLDNHVSNVGRWIEVAKREIPGNERNIENARKQLGKEFTEGDKIDALRKRQSRLRDVMEWEGGEAPTDDNGHKLPMPEELKHDPEDVIAEIGALESGQKSVEERPAPTPLGNTDAEGNVKPRINSHLRRKANRQKANAKSAKKDGNGGQKAAHTPRPKPSNPDAGKRIGDPEVRKTAGMRQVYETVHGNEAGETRVRVLFNVQKDDSGWGAWKPGAMEPERRFGSLGEAERWALAEANKGRKSSGGHKVSRGEHEANRNGENTPEQPATAELAEQTERTPMAEPGDGTSQDDGPTLTFAPQDLPNPDAPAQEQPADEANAPEADAGNGGAQEPPTPEAPAAADAPTPEGEGETTHTVSADEHAANRGMPDYGQQVTLADGRTVTMGQESLGGGWTAEDANGNTIDLTSEDLHGWKAYEAPKAEEDTPLEGVNTPEPEADKPMKAPPRPTKRPAPGAAPSKQGALDMQDTHGDENQPSINDAIASQEAENAASAAPEAPAAPSTPDAPAAPESTPESTPEAPSITRSEVHYGTPRVWVEPYRTEDLRGNPVEVHGFFQNGGLITTESRRVKKDGTLAKQGGGDVKVPQNIADELKRLADESAPEATPDTRSTKEQVVDGLDPSVHAFLLNEVKKMREDSNGEVAAAAQTFMDGGTLDKRQIGLLSSLFDTRANMEQARGNKNRSRMWRRAGIALNKPKDTAPEAANEANTPEADAPNAPEAPNADEAATPEPDGPTPDERTDAQARADAEQSDRERADEATASADIQGERPIPVDAGAGQDQAPDQDPNYVPKTPAQMPDEKFPLTTQGQKIADAAVADQKDVVAEAGAGAGKTTILAGIARREKAARPNNRIGYAAFNKSVQVEAEGRMPDNTESRTGHSLAWQWAGKEFTDKRDRAGQLRRGDQIAKHLGISDMQTHGGDTIEAARVAQSVIRTVDKYANSAEDNIGAEHIPEVLSDLTPADKRKVLAWANKAWDDLRDKDGKINVSFDHIRKMWALSRPDFTKPGSGWETPIDVLFVDEAQDTPPVLAKVYDDQKIRKVIVGDTNQAIYGFTGAIDWLKKAKANVRLPLTKSFRFGPQVADWGNRFLQVLGAKERIIGGGPASNIVRDMEKADAILVRSNGGMMKEIRRELEDGRSVGVPKGTKKDLESLVDSARYLMGEGQAPERMHEDLAPYNTWDEVKTEADKGEDQKLAMLTRMVDEHGVDGLDALVSQVRELEDDPMAGVRTTSEGNTLILKGKGTAELNKRLKKADPNPHPQYGGKGIGRAGFKWNKDDQTWRFTGSEAQQEKALAKLRELAAPLKGETPDVVVSTAHKAKGLEWGRVRIGDDFKGPTVDKNTGDLIMPDDEELKLAYVAVTRAEKELDPGSLSWVTDYSTANGEGKAPEPESVDKVKVPAEDLPTVDGETPAVPEAATPEAAPEAPSEPDVPAAPAEAAPQGGALPDLGLSPKDQAIFDTQIDQLVAAHDGRAKGWRDGEPLTSEYVQSLSNVFRGIPTYRKGVNKAAYRRIADALYALSGRLRQEERAQKPGEHSSEPPKYGFDFRHMDDAELNAKIAEWQDRFDNSDASDRHFNEVRLNALLDERHARDHEGEPTGLEDASESDLRDRPTDTTEERRRKRRERRHRHKRRNPLNNGNGNNSNGGGGMPGALGAAANFNADMPLGGGREVGGSGAGAGHAPLTHESARTMADSIAKRLPTDRAYPRFKDTPGGDPKRRILAAIKAAQSGEGDPRENMQELARSLSSGAGLAEQALEWNATMGEKDKAERDLRLLRTLDDLGNEAWTAVGQEPMHHGDHTPTHSDLSNGERIARLRAIHDQAVAGGANNTGMGMNQINDVGRVAGRFGVDSPVTGYFIDKAEHYVAQRHAKRGDLPEPTQGGSQEAPALRPEDTITLTPEQLQAHRNGEGAPEAPAAAETANVPEAPQGDVPAAPADAPVEDVAPESGAATTGEPMKVNADGLHVGDVIEGKLTNGERGKIKVESVEQQGTMLLVTGTDENGNRAYVRTPAATPSVMLHEAAPDGAPEAWGAPVENRPQAGAGPELPGNLRVGDVIEANVTRNRGKVKAKVRVLAEPQKSGFNHKVQVAAVHSDGTVGEPEWVNLPGSRPVNVLERATTDTPNAPEAPATDLGTDATPADATPAAAEQAVEDLVDSHPEPMVNGNLRNPDGMVLPTDSTGTYSPEQIGYLADYGQQATVNVGDEWHIGHFRPVEGSKDHPEYVFDEIGGEQESPLRFTPDQLHEVRGLRQIEMPGEAVHAGNLRPGTRVAFQRGGKQHVGILTGVTGDGRATIRDAQGETHESNQDGMVRPILGAYMPGAEPTERAVAPEQGVWQQEADGRWGTGVQGEYSAGIAPDGQGGYQWEVHPVPGSGLTGGSGHAASEAAAKDAVDNAVWDMAADPNQANPSVLPGADAAERDQKTRELTDTLAELAQVNNETAPENGIEGDAGQEATPTVEGQPAGWVPTGELEPGDIAHVEGDSGDGSATTRTGHVLGTPESVEVHVPGKVPEGGWTIVMGDHHDGGGDRGTVLTSEHDMAARAERPDGSGDEDNPQSAAESRVLTDHVGDAVPTDSNGLGVFPGSVVHRGGKEGIVTDVTAMDVGVRWSGSHKDERVQAGTLTVDPDKQQRPEGWTAGGQIVRPGHVVQTPDGKHGPVDSMEGDTAAVVLPDGFEHLPVADLKVVGQVRDGEDAKGHIDPTYDVPPSPEGLDTRPTAPVKPEPLADGVASETPNLTPELRRALNDLGLDHDATSVSNVRQAAARVRHEMPLSADQAEALADDLGKRIEAKEVPAKEARKLKRVRNRIAASAARLRGQEHQQEPESAPATATKITDVAPGDVIAVPNEATGQAMPGIVVSMGPAVVREDGTTNPSVFDVTVEHPDGSRSTHQIHQDDEVYRLADLPAPGVPLDLGPVNEDKPFLEPRVNQRLEEAAAAVTDNAVPDEADSLDALGEHVNDALDNHADANDQRNSSRRSETSYGDSGVDPEEAAAARHAADQAAGQVAEEVADTLRNTVEDAEPLPGESEAEAAARWAKRLRQAGEQVDYDQATADALNAADEPLALPSAADKARARRDMQDALRADLFSFAEQLAALGDTHSANQIAQVAARLAGKPDEQHVQRAVRAAAMGREPGKIRSLWARIKGMFARARQRFLDAVKGLMGNGRKARRSLRAAVHAARQEWSGHNDEVRGVVEDTAKHLAAGGDQAHGATDEPAGFAQRMAFWSGQLPDAGSFGRVEKRAPLYKRLSLGSLRGGRNVAPEDTTALRIDRAADGGPGQAAMGHLTALKGLGRAVDDEVHARVRAAEPDLGDDPAGAVAEAMRHAEQVAADERGDLTDNELAKMRKKARLDAEDKAARYANAAAKAARDVLASQRQVGPQGAARLNVQGRKESAPEVKALHWAEQQIPTDWLASAGTVEAKAGRMGGYEDGGTITVAPLLEGRVDGSGKYGASALHGLAHHLESVIPDLAAAQWAYNWDRTSEGPTGGRRRRGRNGLGWLRDMFPGLGFTRAHGKGRAGDYPTPWAGIEFDTEGHAEVLPLALESLFSGRWEHMDYDMRQFLLGALSHIGRNG